MANGKRKVQFGLLVLMGVVFLIAIIARSWAPQIEFASVLAGDSTYTISAWEITGQRRRVECRSQAITNYLAEGLVRSKRSGRAYAEDAANGVPSRRYVPYTIGFQIPSGIYWMGCWISKQDCCLNVPFEDPIVEGGLPNRRFEFSEPMPAEMIAIIEFLHSDIKDLDREEGKLARMVVR